MEFSPISNDMDIDVPTTTADESGFLATFPGQLPVTSGTETDDFVYATDTQRKAFYARASVEHINAVAENLESRHRIIEGEQ